MKEKLFKVGAAVSTGLFALTGTVLAAADADLEAGFASTTAIADDNKSLIINYIVSIFLVVLVIAIAKAGLNWGLRKIVGAFGGGRRRR